MSPKIVDIDSLKKQALLIRREILETLETAGSGHPGGSLSAVEIFIALYGVVMNHRPAEPTWDGRDRFIVSKGHVTPVVYVTLANFGYFPKEELKTFRKFGSRLQGHVTQKTPGVEFNTGSLGHGLPFANGVAMAGRLKGKDYRVYCLMGDGEIQEGSVWEAIQLAVRLNLNNLVVIVDSNKLQGLDRTQEICVGCLEQKFSAFGCNTFQIDGHEFNQIFQTLNGVGSSEIPDVIIADTVKGKGISFAQDKLEWHYKSANEEEYKIAKKEILGI